MKYLIITIFFMSFNASAQSIYSINKGYHVDNEEITITNKAIGVSYDLKKYGIVAHSSNPRLITFSVYYKIKNHSIGIVETYESSFNKTPLISFRFKSIRLTSNTKINDVTFYYSTRF